MITIDLETYHTKDYSLRKLTTEQYIRDERFAVLGVGIKYDNNPTLWYQGDPHGSVRYHLDKINWSDQAVLCHNAAFDMAILGWVYNIRPQLILDTMCMARPRHAHDVGVSLDALADYYNLGRKDTLDFVGWHPTTLTAGQSSELGSYCCTDVDLTYALFQTLRVEFPLVELAVIDRTIRMYSEPSLTLDTAYLKEFAEGRQKENDERLVAVSAMLGREIDEKALNSAKAFSLLLMSLDRVVPMKPSPTSPTVLIPALAKTDMAFKWLLEDENPAVRALAEARLGVKSVLDRTRAVSLLGVASRGALPIMLNYYGAHTGRFSGGEKLNLQNLPRNGKLRKAIIAPNGYIIIAADSSQIEARLTAWLAGQLDLLQQFRDYDTDPVNNPSPYELMASVIYGRIITVLDKLERFVGKTCVLGLGYGMGALKLRVTLRIGQGGISVDYPEDECQKIVDIYRARNRYIKELWKGGERALHSIYHNTPYMLGGKLNVTKAGIHLPNGMVLGYVSLEPGAAGQWGYCNQSKSLPRIILAKLRGEPYQDKYLTRIYGPKVIENVVQALARIVISEQMLVIGRRYRVALQVHDENVVVVKKEEAEVAKQFIKEVMTTPPSWAPDLPVNCSIGVGQSYGDC